MYHHISTDKVLPWSFLLLFNWLFLSTVFVLFYPLFLYLTFCLTLVNLKHILIFKYVTQTDLLRNELTTLTPHLCQLELLWQVSVNLLTYTLNWTSVSVISQNNWISPVRLLVWLLCINSDQIKHFPNLFFQSIKIQSHIATDDNCIWLFGKHVNFFQRNCIDLIVTVQTLDKLSVSWDKDIIYLR